MTKYGFSTFIQSLKSLCRGGTRRRPQRGNAVRLEDLEQRCLPAAVIVAADPGLTTTESGGTAQFTVVLSEQPTKAVKIPIKTSDLTEGTASTKLLIFTSENWNLPQTVTVTGVNDTITDGSQTYSILLGLVKGDKLYKRQDPSDVSLTNQDNDVPGIVINAGNNLQTTESGGTAMFTVRLSSKPTSGVTVSFVSSDPQEGTVTSSVNFTTANWDQPKTITITGANDSLIDGDQGYQISVASVTSSDSNYNGLTAGPVSVTNHDNDVAGLQVSPVSAFSLYEGGSRDVSVKLTAQPTADVTVNMVEIVGANEATLSTTTLTFTPENWNVPQTVTVHASLGDGDDGSQAYAFTLDTVSEDAAFNGVPTKTVNATIVDTDSEPHNLDGTYTGSYTGSVTILGIPSNRSGDVEFTVVGIHVTVTQPADATGTITDNSGTFAPTSGPLVGASFTGTFTENGDGTVTVSGTWTYSHNGVNGSGTWNAIRPAPAS